MKPFGFIYITTNRINGKRYVGQSRKPVDVIYFGSGRAINRAIRKYGIVNFEREIIAFAFSKADLNFLEEHFISEFDAVNSRDWYNMSSAPHVTRGFKGKKHSTEHKEKMSRILSGHTVSEKTREKMKARWAERKERVKLGLDTWIGTKEHKKLSSVRARIMGKKNAMPREDREYQCPVCQCKFVKNELLHHPKKENRCCSRACNAKRTGSRPKIKGQKRPEYSAKSKLRKRVYNDDGTWNWGLKSNNGL